MFRRITLPIVLWASLSFAAAPSAPTNVAPDLTANMPEDITFPFTTFAPNYDDWMMEMAIGNFDIGAPYPYDVSVGSQANWGKAYRCCDGPSGSYKVYCAFSYSEAWPYVMEYDLSTKRARLFLAASGKAVGTSGEVRGGFPFYNPYDDSVYLMGSKFCIRKIDKDTHEVSLVAGQCDTAGHDDGTGAAATFGEFLGAAADGAGNIFVWDKDSTSLLRKITSGGVVTTITDAARSDGYSTILSPLDALRPVLLSRGSDSSHIYIAESDSSGGSGYSVQKFYTSTHEMDRLVGVENSPNDPYGRTQWGGEKDGPALTHARQNYSGIGGFYSPFYDKVFVHGNDNAWPQLYDPRTGWVDTMGMVQDTDHPYYSNIVLPDYTSDEIQSGATPMKDAPIDNMRHPYIKGVDRFGGAYFSWSSEAAGVLTRVYNRTLGGMSLEDLE